MFSLVNAISSCTRPLFMLLQNSQWIWVSKPQCKLWCFWVNVLSVIQLYSEKWVKNSMQLRHVGKVNNNNNIKTLIHISSTMKCFFFFWTVFSHHMKTRPACWRRHRSLHLCSFEDFRSHFSCNTLCLKCIIY